MTQPTAMPTAPRQKRCTKCGGSKHLADFSKDSRNTKDGRQGKCKSCASKIAEISNRKKGKLPQKYNDPNATSKICTKCSKDLPLASYYTDTRTRDGRTSECLSCRRNEMNARNRKKGMRNFDEVYVDVTANGRTCSGCQSYFEWSGFYNTSAKNSPNGKMSKCKTCHKVSIKKYRTENPEWAKGVYLLYRNQRRKCTPPWLNKEQKRQIFKLRKTARDLEIETGVPHHVDHIVPVMGKTVCGLTVPWNLQIITKQSNQQKSNKFVSDW